MGNPAVSRLARRISLRKLQVFEAIGRLPGYTRVAEDLHLAQLTVSMTPGKTALCRTCLHVMAGRGMPLCRGTGF